MRPEFNKLFIMKIYLREDKLILLKESEEEVTFYSFFNEVKNFLKRLLDDPIGAKPGDFFSKHGISRNDLLNKMLERGIVKKEENIDEPNDADGKMKSMHYLQYSVPKKNFETSIHRLYSYFFESEKKKNVNESLWDKYQSYGYNNVRPQQYDSVAVYIFCKNREGKLCVLAGKRRGRYDGGLFNVPTGQIGDYYFNETPEEAAVREVKEESGVFINASQLVSFSDEQYTDHNENIRIGKNYFVSLSGTIDEHMPGVGDGENDRFQWIEVDEIGLYNWAFGQNKNIYNIANTL